ncbi:MAG: hypothetical protein H7Z37_13820 [Pyrinomonadaceae bacterium]|nr:hypothetical protein [Pyrinomonadaceae bacterium]
MSNYENDSSDRKTVLPISREANYLIVDGVDNLQITDDLGNTNTRINDDYSLAVPNVGHDAYYNDVWARHDITMTTERQYTIKFRTETDNIIDIELLRGVGNVSPSYAVRYLDLQLPPNVDCILTITGQGMDDLRYDSNGDGTFDTVVPAHVRVSGTAAQDTDSPKVSINYSEKTSDGLVVTINAVDDETGVKTIYYQLGGQIVCTIYTEPFFVSTTTDNLILAFADDNVGNRSSYIEELIPFI